MEEQVMLTENYARKITVIPAKANYQIFNSIKKARVCAYCRVSTDDEEQESSYELQVKYYTDLIKLKTDWDFAGIYADEYTHYGQNPKSP